MEHKLSPYYSQHGESRYQKQRKCKKIRLRTAMEPVIGHMKTNFRMGQNYFYGDNSAKMNTLLATTGWNLKKLIENSGERVSFSLFSNYKIFPFSRFVSVKKIDFLRID